MSDKKDGIVTIVMVAAMIAEAIKGLVTAEQLQERLIGFAGVTGPTGPAGPQGEPGVISQKEIERLSLELGEQAGKKFNEMILDLVTKSELVEALHELQPHSLEGISGSWLETGEAPQQLFDPEWLEGLTYKGADMETKVVEGRKTLVSTPFERPLTPDDVLSYRVGEDTVTLIAADGKKHVVEI